MYNDFLKKKIRTNKCTKKLNQNSFGKGLDRGKRNRAVQNFPTMIRYLKDLLKVYMAPTT